MMDFLPFIVVGVVNGSLYGLAGMGLVLTYKTSGIFNFAHGAIATVAAYGFYELHYQHRVAWPVALGGAVLVSAVVIGVVLERVGRRLVMVPPAMQVVATVGIVLFVQAVALAGWGAETRNVPSYLPTDNIRLAGVNVGIDQVIVIGIALAAAAASHLLFSRSRLGLRFEAVVDDPALLALGGLSPNRVRRLAWIIGSSFACLSGVLLLPIGGLDANLLTLLVVQAFGAAAVGTFRSVPLSYVGGLALGLVAALATRYVGEARWLAGVPAAVPFIVLLLVLLLTPRHRLADVGTRLRLLTRPPPSFPSPVRRAGLGVTVVTVLVLPLLVGTRLPVYTSALVYVILFLSLHLLVRTSGQISLAHAPFAAVGAAMFAHLSSGLGLPWGVAAIGAALITIPVGAIVAIPAIRLSGVYLAVATLGFGILMEQLVYPMGIMFGQAPGTPGTRSTPRPDLLGLGSDTGYYYLVLASTAVMALLAIWIIRSRLGRLLAAMADAPVALLANGANINVTRYLVFSASAFMAGLAGVLFGALTQSVNAASFTFNVSLQWIVTFAIVGAVCRYAPLPTAILGGVALAVVPTFIRSLTLLELLPAAYGLSAVINAVRTDSSGSGRRLRHLAEQAKRHRSRSPVGARVATAGSR